MTTLMRTLIISATLCVFGATTAEAQQFSECGTVTSDGGGCFSFDVPGFGPLEILVPQGASFPYSNGDFIMVTGTLGNGVFCGLPQRVTFSSHMLCVMTTPFLECGELVQGTGCLLLDTPSGTYEVDNLAGFGVGDMVLVDGNLDAACASSCGATGGCVTATTTTLCTPPVEFLRGDCNEDELVNIADAIGLLGSLFPGPGGPIVNPDCRDSCDANDDGGVNIADGIAILNSLFGDSSMPLPPPVGACDEDPTPDSIFCNTPPSC